MNKLYPITCFIAKHKYYVISAAALFFFISVLALGAPIWLGILFMTIPLALTACSVFLAGTAQKAAEHVEGPPALDETDSEEIRPNVMPQFDFDFGMAQAGIVKRGLMFQMDCAFLFLDADFEGYRLNLIDGGMITLRRGVDYKALALRFVNTGHGEAQNFGVAATYGEETKQFPLSNSYFPDEECEIGLVYARDFNIKNPLHFHLSFFDSYGTHYIQDFELNLDTETSLVTYERRQNLEEALPLTVHQ